MKKLILVSAITTLLAGCDFPSRELVKSETVEVTVISVKRPKHFKLTVKTADGLTLRYSSKRCSRHSAYQTGKKLNMRVETYVVHKGKPNEQTARTLAGVC